MLQKIAALTTLLALAAGQQVGTSTTETHPKMSWSKCSSGGSCTSQSGEVVIDSNWRWVHDKGGYTNCYTGNKWNETICKDSKTCAANCALDGADYPGTYGASTSGNALTLKFVTKDNYGTNIGSRLYLMASSSKYQMFTLLGNEFTFDVDVSKLGCGLNGALYFVSMDEDGGLSKYSTNKAGAKYGTGYCDAQCPRDLKFINGEANSAQWEPSSNDQNAGVGQYGSCCTEMDIWEANSISTAYTPHPCTTVGQHRCEGDGCGGTYSSDRYGGTCDPDGCDFNSYRQGVKDFYGPGMTVDTTKKFTVVTQFISSGGSLSEIKRFYVQDGKTIPNSESTISGNSGNSVTPDFCKSQKTAFGDQDIFNQKGGFAQFSKALSSGMVLVMSLWDDHYANMLWLDSTYPVDASPDEPGKGRGTCDTSSGVPSDIETSQASNQVIYSNIKFGPINSTFTAS
ncbi:putative glycoside hydrolase family 7 protein [Phaeoacremonium minimum UCRPA7]|uniref:Glucanase n=1 Tax=Phaeoacremonium minimum (strain UCR-PA7) TaxID=1286976 RepID=R8BQZ2_PHAM7|nr:putative glycoside hydrolase family 7 protein [Phaeoacremonium minimum UCRPA7]EOO01771.1 putative glycoside hydrolase family 7 protein [Phaeoacremonium minimum UCRPA7]